MILPFGTIAQYPFLLHVQFVALPSHLSHCGSRNAIRGFSTDKDHFIISLNRDTVTKRLGQFANPLPLVIHQRVHGLLPLFFQSLVCVELTRIELFFSTGEVSPTGDQDGMMTSARKCSR